MIDDVNAMFGTNISVKFSPAWELEYSKFIFDSERSDEEFIEETSAEENGENSEDISEDNSEEEGAEDERREGEEDEE